MNKFLGAGAALLLSTTVATAGGLDRSGQGVGVIFEDGDYAEISFGYVSPSVSSDFINGGASMSPAYSQLGFGYKQQINDNVSFALIIDQPFGADVDYVTDSGGALPIAGVVDSWGLTALGRYELNESFSVHGGVRLIQASGELTLGAFANDYNPASGTGYVLGAAYERSDIAMRIALTYSSAVSLELEGATAPTTLTADLPQSVNLDFQTGIAADTLLFGSIRWAEWSASSLTDSGPVGTFYAPSSDSFTYNLGVGRRFSDNLAGSISVSYEEAQGGLASPFSPTDGNFSVQIGAAYTLDNGVEVSGGIRYVKVGDATADFTAFGGGPAPFEGNSAIGVGVKVGFNF